MTDPVFLSSGARGAAVGDTVTLEGAEARHVAVVRLAAGDRIGVVDGAGSRIAGEIVAVSTERVEIRVAATGYDEDAEVVLVQALAKGGRDEQAIEAATELGVTRVIPWASTRSVVRWKGPKEAKGLASWRDRVTAAAKQSRRARVPDVEPILDTAGLANRVSGVVAAGGRVLVLHESADVPLAHPRVTGEPLPPLWLVVGPEGGIADGEVAVLVAAGAELARLGPYVLRSSTAGPAAIAALAVLRGTWAAPWGEP